MTQAAIYLGSVESGDNIIDETLTRLGISVDDFQIFVSECTQLFYEDPKIMLEIAFGEDAFVQYRHGFLAGFLVACQLLEPQEEENE